MNLENKILQHAGLDSRRVARGAYYRILTLADIQLIRSYIPIDPPNYKPSPETYIDMVSGLVMVAPNSEMDILRALIESVNKVISNKQVGRAVKERHLRALKEYVLQNVMLVEVDPAELDYKEVRKGSGSIPIDEGWLVLIDSIEVLPPRGSLVKAPNLGPSPIKSLR